MSRGTPLEHVGCPIGGRLIPREVHPLASTLTATLACAACNAQVEGTPVLLELAWANERARNLPASPAPAPSPLVVQLDLPLDPSPDEPPPLPAGVELVAAPLRRRFAPDGRSFLAVIGAAARFDGVPLALVLGRDRHQSVVAARRRALYDLRRLTGASFEDLAAVVGRSDHAGMIQAVARHERALASGAARPTPPAAPVVCPPPPLPPVLPGTLGAELAARRLPCNGPSWYMVAVEACREVGADPVAFCSPHAKSTRLLKRALYLTWHRIWTGARGGYSYVEIGLPWGVDDTTVRRAILQLEGKGEEQAGAPSAPAASAEQLEQLVEEPPAGPTPRPLAAVAPPPSPSAARAVLAGEAEHAAGERWYEPDAPARLG
jgi:hypothetical protein